VLRLARERPDDRLIGEDQTMVLQRRHDLVAGRDQLRLVDSRWSDFA